MSKTILILGAGQMQVPAIEAAHGLGWKVIVSDGNANAMARTLADHFEAVDLSDPEGMLAMAQHYHRRDGLDGVFTAGTDFSATVAYVAEALGLPGITHEAALNASVKSRMRKIFREAGVPSPRFVELGPDVFPRALDLLYPVVVKPVDSMGARGTAKVMREEDIPRAVTEAREHSRRRTVIVEEFIEGPEYSIDSLVFDGKLHPCGLARRHIHYAPYFIELGHTLPSDLSEEQALLMATTLEQAAQALGITHGAAKGDIFWTERGPVIGEIAARLSGGYMSGWTFPAASGINLTRAALLLAVGERPEHLEPVRHHVAAERALVSIPGRVHSVEGVEKVRHHDGIQEIFLRTIPGERVVFPRNNVQKAGNIIACLPGRKETCQAAENAVATIRITLEPMDQETLAWLGAESHDPVLTGTQDSSPRAYPALFSLVAGIPRGLAHLDSEGVLPVGLPYFDEEVWQQTCTWDYRSLRHALAMLEEDGYAKVRAGGPLSREFWYALARGGVQAGMFLVASLRVDPEHAARIFGELCP